MADLCSVLWNKYASDGSEMDFNQFAKAIDELEFLKTHQLGLGEAKSRDKAVFIEEYAEELDRKYFKVLSHLFDHGYTLRSVSLTDSPTMWLTLIRNAYVINFEVYYNPLNGEDDVEALYTVYDDSGNNLKTRGCGSMDECLDEMTQFTRI